MKVYSRGRIISWTQGRYACLECSHKGRFKHGIMLRSRCLKCSSWMILPVPDLSLVTGPVLALKAGTK